MTVSIICAPDEEKRAAEIKRRLEAGGRPVRIATQEGDYLDPRVPAIVLWSRACLHWAPAINMARAAAAYGSLVPVALEPVDPPIRIDVSPLPFAQWRGEASHVWLTLIDRIERIERRSETRAPRHHFLPMMAMAATGLMVVGFASMLRTEDGAITRNLVNPAQRVLAASATPMSITDAADSVGGPDFLPETLEPDFEVTLIDAPERLRSPRAMQLPAFAEPLPLAEVALRRESVLRQILRAPRELLRDVASQS